MSKKSEIKELAESMSLLMECSHCKQKISLSDPFCKYCGTKQKALESKKQCFCIQCGKEIGLDSSFCSFCGKNQKDIVVPAKPKTIEKKIKVKKTKALEILKCEKCSSENVSIQIIQEKEESGCGTFIVVVVACFVNIILGIFLLILVILTALLKGFVHKKICICQKCGHSWEIK